MPMRGGMAGFRIEKPRFLRCAMQKFYSPRVPVLLWKVDYRESGGLKLEKRVFCGISPRERCARLSQLPQNPPASGNIANFAYNPYDR